eukprot:10463374-Heterocapsa_arctica.AAC.1
MRQLREEQRLEAEAAQGAMQAEEAEYDMDVTTTAASTTAATTTAASTTAATTTAASTTAAGKNDMEVGAGDQGTRPGYASDVTEVCMPLKHSMAKRLGKALTEVCKSGLL